MPTLATLFRGRRDSSPRPKVSILMLTFNHGAFVEQAIESVFAQQTSFAWELVVGDDGSTDATTAILNRYAGEHPRSIRLLLHRRPLGPDGSYLGGKNNFLTTYRACRGEYIAFLDGDDYWVDDHKLQKQVTFLDDNQACSLCCHAVRIEYAEERQHHWPAVIGESSKPIISIEDVLRLESKPEMPMPSMMMRASLLPKFPRWFDDILNGDYALQVLLAERGTIGFLPDRMAVHRKHAGGVSRVYDDDPEFANTMLLRLHLALNEHLGFRYRSILDPYIERERQATMLADSRETETDAAAPSQVIALALDQFLADHGQVTSGAEGEVTIVTSAAPWAYAASLALPTEAICTRQQETGYLRLQVVVAEAPVGIGILGVADDEFIDRRHVSSEEGTQEVILGLPRLGDAGYVIVQTWSEAESSSVRIESAELVLRAVPLGVQAS